MSVMERAQVGTSATVAFLARKPSMALRRAGRTGDNGTAGHWDQSVGDGGQRLRRTGAESDMIKPVAPRQARELSLAAGGGGGTSAALQRSAEIVGSITDRAMRVGIHD
jgi:hypothetical protein